MSLRKFTRLVGALVLAYPAATCTDVTGPHGGPAVQVPIAPTFSRTATFARALYSLAGLDYDRVHVLITRGSTDVLKDTTVDFNSSSPDLTLPLTIAADPGEVVTATLEYRNADLVLYSGTVTVTTIAIGTPGATPTQLVILPVGPGATAALVQVSPSGGTFPTTAPVSFTAQARTSDGTLIPGALFAWTVDDETIATVDTDGVVHPTSKGGTVHVRATTLNEVFGEVTVTFIGVPASLAVQSGGSQSAMAFEALAAPVVVKVLDANGNAVPGAAVTFAVGTGGGSLSSVNGTSDANGLVSASWTLGDVVGTQSITATATALPNAPLTINATATERPAASLAFGQQPTHALMGAQIMPAVTVQALDDHGRVVAGFTGAITVQFNGGSPNGATLGGTLTHNAVAGVATFNDLTVSAAGTGYTLKAGSSGLATVVSSAFDVEQVPAGLSLFAGGSQTANVRATLSPIAVKVADANGNGTPGVTVSFAVVTGGGSLDVASAVTDASGLAHVTWTLGNTVGTQSITATSTGLAGSPLTITAEATPLPAAAIEFVQQPTNVAVNATMAPAVTVRAKDADGNTVTGFTGIITLAFDVNAGSGTLSGTTSVAAVNGVATFSNLSINAVGTGYKLKASTTGLTTISSSAFNVVAGAPAALVFLVQPSSAIVSTIITPAIKVKIVDASGNTVLTATDQVTLGFNGLIDALLGGTKTVNAVNGVATFSDIAISPVLPGIKLKATATGLTTAISASFDILPVPGVLRTWTGANSSDWNDAGNWSPASVPAPQDTVSIPSATNSPVVTTNSYARFITIESGGALQVNATGGTYLNTDTITNKGTLTLTYALLFGPIRNSGTVIVDGVGSATTFLNAPGATTRIIGGTSGNDAVLTVGQGFDNSGLVELTDAGGGSADLSVGDSLVNHVGATINVLPGGGGGIRAIVALLRNHGALNVSSTAGLIMEHIDGGASVNDGTISVTAGGDFTQVFSDTTTTFTNSGTIAMGTSVWETDLGKLVLRAGTVTGSGLFRSYASALDIDYTKFPLPMRLDDNSRVAGSTFDVPAGQTVTLTGSTILQPVTVNGTLRVMDTLSYDVVLFQGGATINDNGVLSAEGDVQMNDAFAISKSGKLRIVSTGGFDRAFYSAKPFVNDGQIEMTSTGLGLAVLNVNGLFTNSATGTLSALGGFGGERRIEARLDNKGAIFVAQDSYLKLQSPGVISTNSGTITLEDSSKPGSTAEFATSFVVNPFAETGTSLTNTGTISVGANRTFQVLAPSTFGNEGLIVGTGTIDVPTGATFSNDGTINPGKQGEVGTLTYNGDFDMGKGTIEIDVSTITANGSIGDLFQVTGSAAVGSGAVAVVESKDFSYPDRIGAHLAINAFKGCTGVPIVEPSESWRSYNSEGCVYVAPIILARKTTTLTSPKRPPGTSR